MTKKLSQPYFSTDVVVDAAGWEKIEAAGAISLAPVARSRLIGQMNDYGEDIDGYNAAVRPGRVRPLLTEFDDALQSLQAVLTRLLGAGSPEQSAALREIQRAAARDFTQIAGRRAIDDLRATLRPWSGYAAAALKALPHDKGASGDPFLGRFLLQALAVFRESGGKGVYTSKATAFLKVVCATVGNPVQSDAALHQAIKQAISADRKKVREKVPT